MLLKLLVLVRWLGSLLIGAAVVYLMLVSGLYFSGHFDELPSTAKNARAVDLLGELDRVRLRDELDLGAPRTRAIPPPPPPVSFSRQVSGFVQLEVEIGTNGDVLDARVLGAVPEGFYEQQALQEVRQRRYEPAPIGRYRQTEVVPFNITVAGEELAPEG